MYRCSQRIGCKDGQGHKSKQRDQETAPQPDQVEAGLGIPGKSILGQGLWDPDTHQARCAIRGSWGAEQRIGARDVGVDEIYADLGEKGTAGQAWASE